MSKECIVVVAAVAQPLLLFIIVETNIPDQQII